MNSDKHAMFSWDESEKCLYRVAGDAMSELFDDITIYRSYSASVNAHRTYSCDCDFGAGRTRVHISDEFFFLLDNEVCIAPVSHVTRANILRLFLSDEGLKDNTPIFVSRASNSPDMGQLYLVSALDDENCPYILLYDDSARLAKKKKKIEFSEGREIEDMLYAFDDNFKDVFENGHSRHDYCAATFIGVLDDFNMACRRKAYKMSDWQLAECLRTGDWRYNGQCHHPRIPYEDIPYYLRQAFCEILKMSFLQFRPLGSFSGGYIRERDLELYVDLSEKKERDYLCDMLGIPSRKLPGTLRRLCNCGALSVRHKVRKYETPREYRILGELPKDSKNINELAKWANRLNNNSYRTEFRDSVWEYVCCGFTSHITEIAMPFGEKEFFLDKDSIIRECERLSISEINSVIEKLVDKTLLGISNIADKQRLEDEEDSPMPYGIRNLGTGQFLSGAKRVKLSGNYAIKSFRIGGHRRRG